MRGRILEKLARIRSRHVADVIIGFLVATSSVWIDVTLLHRFVIGVTVAFAFETVFSKLDEREMEEFDEDEEDVIDLEEMMIRKQRNRDFMFGERKMP